MCSSRRNGNGGGSEVKGICWLLCTCVGESREGRSSIYIAASVSKFSPFFSHWCVVVDIVTIDEFP